jgi:hypothetical protein
VEIEKTLVLAVIREDVSATGAAVYHVKPRSLKSQSQGATISLQYQKRKDLPLALFDPGLLADSGTDSPPQSPLVEISSRSQFDA